MFITGGSSGLGLALAKAYAHAGAHVSIVARDVEKLDAAKTAIEAVVAQQQQERSDTSDTAAAPRVFAQSCDVTDFAAMQRAVAAALAFHGRAPDHVICSAGASTPAYFVDTPLHVFRSLMDVNYFGVVHTLKAALPAMVAQRSGGHVVIVSSGLGLTSWIGYSQYSAFKYATHGLADALRNELLAYNVRMSIFFPGNIDTPMFAHERLTKPPETQVIEGVSEVLSAETVAALLLRGLRDGEFGITNELLIFFLRALANGVAPRQNSVLELALVPLMVPAQMVFGLFMDAVVRRAAATDRRKRA